MFSKECEYAIRAVLYIATQSQNAQSSGMKAIAAAIDSPEAFTAKILQKLTRANLIQSVKGPNGGFFMDAQNPNKTKLIDIVRAIDGDRIFTGCGLGLKQCNALNPCPLHHTFKKIRDDIQQMLESSDLDQLAADIHTGSAFLRSQ